MSKSVIFLIVFASFACTQEPPTLFEKVEEQHSGIDFINQLTDQSDQNIIDYLYYYNGGGIAVGDLNNDGLEDVYFTGNQVSDRLYLNKGNLSFEDVTTSSGIAADGWSTGVTMADINQDGWLDIYVCQVGSYGAFKGRNRLYINQADGTFIEAASDFGLDFSGFSTQSAFFDYDGDGDLDMFLLNHAVHTSRSYQPAVSRRERDPLAGDYLFQSQISQGVQKFKDISVEAGIFGATQGYGLGLVVDDFNNDNWPDIYVGNDFHEDDYLYINQQNGTFEETLKSTLPHTSRFTMGVDAADMNGDQIPDIFQLDMHPDDPYVMMKSGGEDSEKVSEVKLNYGYHFQYARNNFHMSTGNGKGYKDIALLTDMYATDWSWSVLLQDFDNDGLRDIFISNGIYKRPNDLDYINYLSNFNLSLYSDRQQDSIEALLIDRMPTIKIPNRAFKQVGPWTYADNSKAWGLDEPSYSNGTVYADLDLDGDLDLLVNNINQTAFVYENKTDSTGNYLSVRLDPGKTGSSIGAKVMLYQQGQELLQSLYPVRGFQSSVSQILHFGLQLSAQVDSLRVVWPDRSTDKWTEIQPNQLISLKKSANGAYDPVRSKISKYNLQAIDYVHQEDRYQDYNREPLIPHLISKEGPAAALADFDQDGKMDAYLGGAHFAPANIMYDLQGKQSKIQPPVFMEDENFEDVYAIAEDFNGDGRKDIYVVSGGNKFDEGSPLLMDRLYLNNLDGSWTKKDQPFPSSNGAFALSLDWEGDGDHDLFVAGRSVPGSYGISPLSHIMLNDGEGNFTLLKQMELGMLTAGVKVDHNGDDEDDIVLVGEWEPVKVISNEGGKPQVDIIQGTNGWYRSIAAVNVNEDAHPDYILGSYGLNSKLKASKEQPMTLFVDDFDRNGQVDQIMFHYFNNENVPFHSRDQLIAQMPALKKGFIAYQDFANIRTLEGLLKPIGLGSVSIEKETYSLSHQVLISKKVTGGFAEYYSTDLPIESQLSTMNSISTTFDFNKDGAEDLLIGGNFYGPVTSIGRYDASRGCILIRDAAEVSGYRFGEFLGSEFPKQIQSILAIDQQSALIIENDGQARIFSF